jgi:prepilin-type N-terminal cleavage/methylation domain-containing protein
MDTPQMSPSNLLKNDSGFTLIELLTVIMIVASLAMMSITGFTLYKRNAQFAQAQVTMHSARTALEAGITDNQDSGTVSGWSASDGSDLVAPLSDLFPSIGVPKDVRMFGAQTDCGDGSYMYSVIVYACKADKYTSWVRTCAGFEVANEGEVAGMC